MAYETTSEAREPVQDWASDWDWLDEQWGPNAPEIWRDLREAGCPMAFTERYGRAWMPVTHEAVAQIANDTEHFSSYRVSVSRPDSPLRKAPPITLDPPEHHAHRRILLPPFNPKRVAELEQPTRRYCQALIAKLAGRFRADAAVDYAQNIPVHVIAGLIGVPESDADIFRDWVHRNFQEAPRDNKAKEALMADMWEYFGRLLDARTLHPQGDLTSMLIDAEIEGRLLTRDEQIGYLVLLILAGIDTTWGSIGSGLWYFLAEP